MAVDVASGTFIVSSATTAGNTAATVSGLSFQPKAVFLSWSGRASAGQGEADSLFGAGFFTGTSSRRAFATQSDHSPTTMATDHIRRNDAAVATMTIAGAVGGLADVSAINSDGFTLVVDDQFPADLIVGWIAYGGADITDVAIVDITTPASPGDQDINVGFALNTGEDDKAVVMLGSSFAAFGTSSVYSLFSFGVAAGDSIGQAVMAGSSADGAATSSSGSYTRSGEIAATMYDDVVEVQGSLTAWLSTGFRLNWSDVSGDGDLNFSALVIKGGRWFVGDAVTSTGTSNQTEATPYVPKALLIGSSGRAASTVDTSSAHYETIIGAATGATSRWSASLMDKDNAGNADVGVAFATDAMYVNQSTAATVVQEGAMDLVSFDATPGFTYVMDDADPAQAFFFYLGAADIPVGGVQPMASMYYQRLRH